MVAIDLRWSEKLLHLTQLSYASSTRKDKHDLYGLISIKPVVYEQYFFSKEITWTFSPIRKPFLHDIHFRCVNTNPIYQFYHLIFNMRLDLLPELRGNTK